MFFKLLIDLQVQQQQHQQGLASAGMMPTLPFPFYQGVVYSPVLGDPYQQAVGVLSLPGHASPKPPLRFHALTYSGAC